MDKSYGGPIENYDPEAWIAEAEMLDELQRWQLLKLFEPLAQEERNALLTLLRSIHGLSVSTNGHQLLTKEGKVVKTYADTEEAPF